MMDISAKFRRGAVVLTFAIVALTVSQPAFAVVPEVVVDPRTGKAEPNHDLERALVALSTPQRFAEIRWQRAPWFAS